MKNPIEINTTNSNSLERDNIIKKFTGTSPSVSWFDRLSIYQNYKSGHYILGLISLEDIGLPWVDHFFTIEAAYKKDGYEMCSFADMFFYANYANSTQRNFFECSKNICVMMEPVLDADQIKCRGMYVIDEFGRLEEVSMCSFPEQREFKKTAIFLARKPVKSIKDQLTETLIERYTNDIIYDVHSTEVKIQRSFAKKELQRRGSVVLKKVALEMKRLFINQKIDYDLFMAWISLIYDIKESYKLPETPYARDVKYGDMEVLKWVHYCFSNG